MTIFYIIIGVLLAILFRMIKEDVVKWKRISYLQLLLYDFNEKYERFQEFLNSDATWEEMIDLTDFEKEEAIEDEAICIAIGKKEFYITNAQKLRLVLMELGIASLRLEEILVEQYGEMEYNESYIKFRKRLVNIRQYALSKGETVSTIKQIPSEIRL